MELELKRDSVHTEGFTLGKLYIGGACAAQTLEDEVREVEGQPVESWKIKHETAIPRGRYRVTIEHSPRFGKDLPRLHDVPGYQGVLIHSGNTVEDTSGCILVGIERYRETVTNSRLALHDVMTDIQEALNAGEQVWITVS